MAQVTASGSFNWSNGNIAGGDKQQDQVLMNGETVQLLVWTIETHQGSPGSPKSLTAVACP
jgi:hypothetical protein